jgi:RpiR family carbohydrate utilization transcriptional regulator
VPQHPRADPPVGGTLSYIESLLPALVPSEQRVAREIVDHPGEVALLSASDVAALTGTSPATVIRACQSMGFKGFQQLRLLLLRDLPSLRRAGAVVSGDGPPREWLPALFRTSGDDLAAAIGPLDYGEFERAAAAVAAARRLLIVGNGGSAPVAQMASLGFLSSGRPNEAPVDSVVQQLTAAALGDGDACICVSSSGANSVTMRAAEAAKRAGASVVAVTAFQRSPIEEVSDIVLVSSATTPNWAQQPITGNLAHFVLLAGLQVAVSAAAGRAGMNPAVIDEVIEVLGDGLA